jgi:hypothetical protein
MFKGVYEQSKSLPNQQETKTLKKIVPVGSSETKTQSFPQKIEINSLPTHIKDYNRDFID